MIRYIILLILVSGCWLNSGYAQNKDPEVILNSLREQFMTIQDFTANVEIKINVDFINIPDKYATLYFKKPDKLKFKSRDFIMIPRKGIGFSIIDLLDNPYSPIYVGQVSYSGRLLEELKIVPLGKKSDVVLATCWIDPADHLIYRLEADTRKSGYFITYFEYGENAPLPDKNIVQFEVDELKLPLRFMGKVDVDRSKMSEKEVGEVIITYSDYQINVSLTDDIFYNDSTSVNDNRE
jgi:hypothetical protein